MTFCKKQFINLGIYQLLGKVNIAKISFVIIVIIKVFLLLLKKLFNSLKRLVV